MMNNPLLENHHLPAFSQIRPEHVEPAVRRLIDASRQAIEERLAQGAPYSWANLIEPLEDIDDRINRAWSQIGRASCRERV